MTISNNLTLAFKVHIKWNLKHVFLQILNNHKMDDLVARENEAKK